MRRRCGVPYSSVSRCADRRPTQLLLSAISEAVTRSVKRARPCHTHSARDVHRLHYSVLLMQHPDSREQPLAGMRVLVDAGNGAGGFFASEVLAPLGADINGSQFLEPDGTFPNHVPNPEDQAAMSATIDAGAL
jgi:phosphomannomutase